MHELGLLLRTADLVTRTAEENHIDHVAYISVDIPEASGVLPELFEDYFPAVREQYPVLADAELRMRVFPSKAICLDCDALYDVMKFEGKCPGCGSTYKKLTGSRDVTVHEIGY